MNDRPRILLKLGDELERVARETLSDDALRGHARRPAFWRRVGLARPVPGWLGPRAVVGGLSLAVTLAIIVVAVIAVHPNRRVGGSPNGPAANAGAVANGVRTATEATTQTAPSLTIHCRRAGRPVRCTLPVPIGPAAQVKIAAANARDTPLELFTRNPARVQITPSPRETVIPASIRQAGTFSLPGIGRLQFWVARSRQHGVCVAVRPADRAWLGLDNHGSELGPFPGCFPTRAQTGEGALIIDGFDFDQINLVGRQGQKWILLVGKVSTAALVATVTDTFSHRMAPLVSDNFFALAVHPFHNDYGDYIHLQARNAAGQIVATQGTPLPGTMITVCAGHQRWVRERIPYTHRYTMVGEGCSKSKRVRAK